MILVDSESGSKSHTHSGTARSRPRSKPKANTPRYRTHPRPKRLNEIHGSRDSCSRYPSAPQFCMSMIKSLGQPVPPLVPRILSLDGGGVRGISSLYILKELMAQTARQQAVDRPNDPKSVPRPCEVFDMICGTSTGGLIALMLGRLEMVIPCPNRLPYVRPSMRRLKLIRVLQSKFSRPSQETQEPSLMMKSSNNK